MPRTKLDRMNPEKVREHFVKDLRRVIDSHRSESRPTFAEIGDHIGVSRRTMQAKLKTGGFSLEEFASMAKLLRFTDAEILKLIEGRSA